MKLYLIYFRINEMALRAPLILFTHARSGMSLNLPAVFIFIFIIIFCVAYCALPVHGFGAAFPSVNTLLI